MTRYFPEDRGCGQAQLKFDGLIGGAGGVGFDHDGASE